MSLFKDMLKDEESLFLNPEHLDYDYQPKITPHREQEQKYIASCIKPLFQNRNGKNIFIFGSPGIGKTVSTKHILKEIEETTDDILPLYINCWKHETTYQIVLEICNQLNYKFIQNKKISELYKEIAKILNEKTSVIILDEIDKIQEHNAIYTLLEDIYKKTIILISNNKSWLINLDPRLRSRLSLDELEFKPYNLKETEDILKTRKDYAFVANIFEENAFKEIVKKTFELKDIRTGLFLLKESGNIAENKSLRKITREHALEAIEKLRNYNIKSSKTISLEDKDILNLIKQHSGKQIKDLYEIYKKTNNKSYRTFQRKLEELKLSNLIEEEPIISVQGGRTIIIKYKTQKN